MEIKINREIREYTEAMYFGLSLRQFICAALLWAFIFCSAPIWAWKPSVGCACWGQRPLRLLDLSNITE